MSDYSNSHKRDTIAKAAAQIHKSSGGKTSPAQAKKRLVRVMNRIDRKKGQ